jgi:hypothetical protein
MDENFFLCVFLNENSINPCVRMWVGGFPFAEDCERLKVCTKNSRIFQQSKTRVQIAFLFADFHVFDTLIWSKTIPVFIFQLINRGLKRSKMMSIRSDPDPQDWLHATSKNRKEIK